MTGVDVSEPEKALEIVRAAGYVAVKAKSYRAAQERQRIAEALKESAERQIASTEAWARSCCDEERRVRERLMLVWGLAAAHGATLDELRAL